MRYSIWRWWITSEAKRGLAERILNCRLNSSHSNFCFLPKNPQLAERSMKGNPGRNSHSISSWCSVWVWVFPCPSVVVYVVSQVCVSRRKEMFAAVP